jgi:transposase
LATKPTQAESCESDLPRLITQVTTTIGPIPDGQTLPDIQAVLDQRDWLPEQHIVDAGYVDAELLVASQTQYQVDLVGPDFQGSPMASPPTDRLCASALSR